MANVYGEAFQKVYRDEPKEFVTGRSHAEIFLEQDRVASATASDRVFFGKIPTGSQIYNFRTKNGVSISLEDEAGNPLAEGDVTSSEVTVVAIPAAALSNDIVYLEYLQN